MAKLSEIAAVIEDHAGPYQLIDIHANRSMVMASIEHSGPDDLSAQAKFGISFDQLVSAVDWHQLVQVQTRQAVADLDRFLGRGLSTPADADAAGAQVL